MRKILVTGGLGFIGSHTVVELLNSNYEVIIIDNLSNTSIDVIEGVKKITNKKPKFIKLDLKEKNQVLDFFKKYKFELSGVIHFAAHKAVGESIEDPLKYYENNLYSLINILTSIKSLDLKINFIFSSSCTVYGQSKSLPITESEPTVSAESPYGNTKQVCEEIIKDFTRTYANLNVVSLRYFNPIGAHPSSIIGELPLGKPQNLIPFITQTAIGLYPELIVFGEDYNTKDGTCVRDYIDVVDLAKAHIASLEYLQNDDCETNYEIYNVGTGIGHSVLEVIKCFEEVNDIKINFSIGAKRPGDVEIAYADTLKANNRLKWKSKISLKDSLRNAWRWEKHIRIN